jgi:hypothetical protein
VGSPFSQRSREARSRRVRAVRSVTLSNARPVSKAAVARMRARTDAILADVVELPTFPLTRAECIRGPRPCPWWRCRYHLGSDVSRNGSLKITWPDLQPWEIPFSCALDLAESTGLTLEEVGEALNVTRERVRQIEHRALAKLESAPYSCALREFLGKEDV